MTIVVGYLWVAPPNQATVLPDGTVSWPGVRRIVGESERVAIEFAKTVAEASGSRLVGITVGDETTAGQPAASAGLACGLDEAIVVRTAAAPGTAEAAAGLAAAIPTLDDVRLVVLGSSASDSGTRLLAGYLGGLLGWPVLADVTDAGFGADGLWAENEHLNTRRHYRIGSPAVLSVTASARVPRQMGLREIMAAGSKPSRIVTAEELGAAPCGPLEVVSTAELAPSSRRAQLIHAADPDHAADQVVTALRARGVL